MSQPGSLTRRSFRNIARADFDRLKEHLSGIDLSGKTLLVSGATGFFGAWLLALFDWWQEQHPESGFRVMAISRDPAAFVARHGWAADAPWLAWIKGDIGSFDFPSVKIDWIIHAATTPVPKQDAIPRFCSKPSLTAPNIC